MIKFLVAYGITAAVFLGVDFIWLSRVMRQFYVEKLGGLLLETPNFAAAVAFYVVYIGGIIFFAVAPALARGSVGTALLHGALFGFFAYATYDMTNYATLKNWSLSVSIADIVWGTFLTALSAAAGYYGTRLILQA